MVVRECLSGLVVLVITLHQIQSGSAGGCPIGCAGGCDSSNCSSCLASFHGPRCELHCPVSCRNDRCHQENGTCVACITGYHGTQCQAICPLNCLRNNCNMDTGHCLSCKPGFWGFNCAGTCARGCKDRQCNSDGSCECRKGYYGMRCDAECSPHCVMPCHHVTGLCTVCQQGYSGSFCGTPTQGTDGIPGFGATGGIPGETTNKSEPRGTGFTGKLPPEAEHLPITTTGVASVVNGGEIRPTEGTKHTDQREERPISLGYEENNTGRIVGLAILTVCVVLSIAIFTFTCKTVRKKKSERPTVQRESSSTNINLAFESNATI